MALAAALVLLLRAVQVGNQPQEWVFKPLCTMLVIGLGWWKTASASSYRRWILRGLGASLAGDILLMLPQDLFLPGLAAFLVAHLCYLLAFTTGTGFRAGPVTGGALVLAAALVLGAMWPGLGGLKGPVVAYIAVIVLMAWQALERWREGAHRGTALAALGALLFMTSDALLGIARFRDTFPGSRVLVLATYYAAQYLIATSVRLRMTDRPGPGRPRDREASMPP